MGAANAMNAYSTYGSLLSDRALRALVYMALVSADHDAEPWYGQGAEALSEMALSRKVPSAAADRVGHEAALRAVGRVVMELKKAGAIRLAERARFGAHRSTATRYRLYLGSPCPDKYVTTPRGNTTPPHRPSDRRRPNPSDAECVVENNGANTPSPPPSDVACPMGSDDPRSTPWETIGQSVAGHRTDNDRPSDTGRPNKEEEEEEERWINVASAVDRTVEDAPRDFRLIEGRSSKRGGDKPGAPASRKQDALWPAGVETPGEEQQPDRHTDQVTTAVIDAVRETTGEEIPAAHARRVAGDILAGRSAASPAAYVRKAILAEPDPDARFLPLPDGGAQSRTLTCPTHSLDYQAGGECRSCAADRKAAS